MSRIVLQSFDLVGLVLKEEIKTELLTDGWTEEQTEEQTDGGTDIRPAISVVHEVISERRGDLKSRN